MISFVDAYARRSAGISAQAAPASMPATAMQAIRIGVGAPDSQSPTPEAPIAPQ